MPNVFLDHISGRVMIHEKSLLVFWASKGHNVTIILTMMDGCLGPLAPSYPVPGVGSGLGL
jgi:hypothetical protein